MTNLNAEIVRGKLKTGYDYELQCWVENYIIQPCGHPKNMRLNCCFAGKNSGLDIRNFYTRITSSGKYDKEQRGV